jgi:hypothetical protein
VAAWEAVIVDMTKQEMLHLALAIDLLSAIGAAPHLHRPNFPILSRWYPPGVQIALVPFGERALRHFIYLERPEGGRVGRRGGLRCRRPGAAADRRRLADGGPGGLPDCRASVPRYRARLEAWVGRHGEAGVFIGPPEAQATTKVFEWTELIAVTDLASASAAIELIVEQGGARGDWRDAHFGKFVALLDDYLAARAADPGFQPARPVVPAYVRRPPDVQVEALRISDPLTVEVADLFNAVYQTTLPTAQRATRTGRRCHRVSAGARGRSRVGHRG